VDIPTRADARKMVDVTKALVAVSFNHKTHRNLSEEAREGFTRTGPILRMVVRNAVEHPAV
ncbi:hypothetical protein Bca52824_097117, partial [Brassica carinata]